MEWPRELRYRRIEEVAECEITDLKNRVDACSHRQTFHIQPTTGLLNDPNGFSFYNGEYHLFYQWFPLGPVHGVKYWYHTASKDLVNWENRGIALSPDCALDSHGVFSGTAIEHNGLLYLMYTGNTRDENWIRHPYQCLAVMNETGEIKKYPEAVIKNVPKEITDNFRDPKVFKIEDKFYCIVGAEKMTDEGNKGTVVYYESSNLEEWTYKGEINTTFENNSGFMWECPDYFTLEGQGIMLMSPQGMAPEGDKYQNVFQSGYLVGEPINFETGIFNHGEFTELDRGFEFYAPQTMEDPKGRRILVGWLGLPELDCVTDESGWAHCLTLPRELTVKNNKLIQKPIEELKKLRHHRVEVKTTLNAESKKFMGFEGITYELQCRFTDLTQGRVGVKLRKSEQEETVFYYDIENKKLVLNREKSGKMCGEEYGSIRQCHFEANELRLQIFVDQSSVEIFVSDGEEVFTTRIFTKEESQGIEFFADSSVDLEATLWEIKK